MERIELYRRHNMCSSGPLEEVKRKRREKETIENVPIQ
jgi:hypothetical protein